MKMLAAILRVLGVLLFTPFVYVLFFYEAAREAHLKRKLGRAYEGPSEE